MICSPHIPRALAALITLTAAAVCHAQWTITVLDPAGSVGGYGEAGSRDLQVGFARLGTSGTAHAGLWSGSAASWVDLNPLSASSSDASCVSGNQEAGSATFPTYVHGGYWTGTAASWVDLNPVGAARSAVAGTCGTQQVGSAWMADNPNYSVASLWSGTSGSWVNLNPAGAIHSDASATSGVQQVGEAFAYFGGTPQTVASLWSGTAASWVNLNPAGASNSSAEAISGNIEGGIATFNGQQNGGIWRGTAASWVNLNPPGASASMVAAVVDGIEVGVAKFNGQWLPGFWTGTASSWRQLPLLPSEPNAVYGSYSLSRSKGMILITGVCLDEQTNVEHALLWTRPELEVRDPN